MKNIRIVIVDDSPFSIAFIKDILENNGFEVVGEAGSLDEVKEVVKDKMPDLVTMDMTLPGTDGLECTRAIHEIDENIKVIVISSMMDDEIVSEAKRNKVSSYIQKPVDADALVTAINRIMATEELYEFLQQEYFEVFKEALKDSVNRMAKELLTYKEEHGFHENYEPNGITIIIGIIGKFSGRMLLNLSKETAEALTAATLKRAPKSNDETAALLAELSNIISGNACSVLNMKNKAYGLRVAPPSILFGNNVLISPPDFSTSTAAAETAFGGMMLNVGFKRGEDRWI